MVKNDTIQKDMKKFLPVIIIVLILLVAGVGYYMYSQKGSAKPSTANTAQQNTSMFSSIKDALSKSLSLQCTFSDETGRQTTAYIKAGAVRADVVGKNPSEQYNNSSVIMKDKKLYMWDTVKKQGITMTLNDENLPTGTVNSGSGSPSQNSAGDMMAALEKYKNDCKPAVISDSLFVAPTDVTFSDLSKMMQPTGAVNQQNVQQMMQQYQQQNQNSGSTGY